MCFGNVDRAVVKPSLLIMCTSELCFIRCWPMSLIFWKDFFDSWSDSLIVDCGNVGRLNGRREIFTIEFWEKQANLTTKAKSPNADVRNLVGWDMPVSLY